MARDRKARLAAQNSMCAWANLVGSILQTMKMADVPECYVHYFLDRLERSCEETLVDEEAEFAAHIIGVFRGMVERSG